MRLLFYALHDFQTLEVEDDRPQQRVKNVFRPIGTADKLSIVHKIKSQLSMFGCVNFSCFGMRTCFSSKVNFYFIFPDLVTKTINFFVVLVGYFLYVA